MDQFTDENHGVIIQERTPRTAFCNYLALEVEGLEEKDFQTFRNEAVKLLSNIQSRAEHGHQPQQQPLSCCSSAASTLGPQTFQQPHQPAPAGIHVNHTRDMDAFKPGHPTCSAVKWQPKDSSSNPQGSRLSS